MRSHDRKRKVLIETTFADISERPHLDESQLHAAPVRPLQQRGELPERNGIDLHLEPGRLRGIDAGQTLSSSPQRVTARNLLGSRVSSEAGSSAGQYLFQFEGGTPSPDANEFGCLETDSARPPSRPLVRVFGSWPHFEWTL